MGGGMAETNQKEAWWTKLWWEGGKDGQYFKIFSHMGEKHTPGGKCLSVRFIFFFNDFLTNFDFQVQSLLADFLQGLTNVFVFDEI
jgi:hypothetical protein